ncbi:MAG: histidinol-phosphatase HisJ [Eubacterium sp.]
MIKSNYHIHSTYCDGENDLEEMVIAAVASGLTSIGFTGHMSMPYKNDVAIPEADISSYMTEVRALAEKYKKTIAIYLGMEVDYFIDKKDISSLAKQIIPELDFFIGSIHVMGLLKNGNMAEIDYTPENFRQGIEECYNGSARALVEAYYSELGNMALKLRPDIIGHLDIIKKNNENGIFFDEDAIWYKHAVRGCLSKIKKSGSIIEINTGGIIRYGERCLYPEWWIIHEIKKSNIPIMLNGDSHSIEGIAYHYEQIEELLKAVGFKEVMMLENNKWQSISI